MFRLHLPSNELTMPIRCPNHPFHAATAGRPFDHRMDLRSNSTLWQILKNCKPADTLQVDRTFSVWAPPLIHRTLQILETHFCQKMTIGSWDNHRELARTLHGHRMIFVLRMCRFHNDCSMTVWFVYDHRKVSVKTVPFCRLRKSQGDGKAYAVA